LDKSVEIEQLDNIISETVASIEDRKKEIFEISERARQDYSFYTQELHNTKTQLTLIINEVDKLEIRSQMAKNMIKAISEHYDEFSEKDVREAYELSQEVQVELTLKRREENLLNERMKDFEKLLVDSKEIISKSESLETKVSVALNFIFNSSHDEMEDKFHHRDVGMKIIEAQENEKKRISRDIHDGPAQSLANIIYKTEYLSKIIELPSKKVKKEIQEIQEDIRGTLKDIRKIIYDLMPMSLDDLGLVPTLKKLISDIERGSGVKVHSDFQLACMIDNSMTNLMIFRVIQECFNNIIKHAHCKNIYLSVVSDDLEINVIVRDDGQGFDIERALKENKGYGLYNMKERIELLNGLFSIETNAENGTTVKMKIPNN